MSGRRLARRRESTEAEGPAPMLYSLDDAAKVLGGMSRSTLVRLIRVGKIKKVKIGRRTYIADTELRRYVDSLANPLRRVG